METTMNLNSKLKQGWLQFEADPFDDTSPALWSLQSGVTASPEILADLQHALQEGSEQAKDVLEKRVFAKELPLSPTL